MRLSVSWSGVPGSETTTFWAPWVLISASETPAASMRDRMISTANKLCVIEGISEEMAPDLASGLAAVLSSQYYERYCTLTGRFASVTNAALAALPLPEKDVLLAIGRKLAVARSYSLRASNAVASAALAAYFGGL